MNKQKIFLYFVILFVIFETFSIIRGYVLVRDWIPIGLLLASASIFYPKSFLNKETFFLLAYFFFVFIRGGNLADTKQGIVELTVFLACLSIINVFYYQRDISGLKKITGIGLFIIVVTSLFTIPQTINNPNAVRSMVAYSVLGDIDSTQLSRKLGIASYGLVHALPMIFPLLVCNLKNVKKKRTKSFYLVAIVVPYYMILKASFGTALILSTFGIIVAILMTLLKKMFSHGGLILLLIVMVISLNDYFVISFLNEIKPIFGGTKIESRIDDIVISLKSDTAVGTVAVRESLYKDSWNTFFQYPLFGTTDKTEAGGHSYFPDRLAYYGLVGIIPLFMFFYILIKKQYMTIAKEKRNYYVLSILIFFIMGFFKNISGIENFLYLFVFLPGLCFMGKTRANTIVSSTKCSAKIRAETSALAVQSPICSGGQLE